MIDAGRREEAPGANKSPALGRAAPGRESFARSGHPQQWPPPRPPQGKPRVRRGRLEEAAGSPGAPGRPRRRLSAHSRGSQADGTRRRRRGEPLGGPGARALRGAAPAGPGRGSKAAAVPGSPPGAVGGLPGGDRAHPHRPPECGGRPRPEIGPGSWGGSAANGPVGRAFLWRSAQAVRPSYGVSGETAGMTAAGWARTMANSTAARVRLSVLTPDRAPASLPISPSPPSRLGRKARTPCGVGAHPVGHPVWAITFPLGRECSGASSGCHGGVSKPLRRLSVRRLAWLFCLWRNACALTSLPWGIWGLGWRVWQLAEDGSENNAGKTFPGLCAPVTWTSCSRKTSGRS